MAAGKEIRGKIKSVENTKKITKAMEMVSVSKMRKAQERMRAARPYSEKIRNIAANLGQANPVAGHSRRILGDDVPADLLDGALQPRRRLVPESQDGVGSAPRDRRGEPFPPDRRPEPQDEQPADESHPEHHDEGANRVREWVHECLIP